MKKKPRGKIEENRVEPNSEQNLEEQLSEGFFYCCKYHYANLTYTQIPLESLFEGVQFKLYYIHMGAKLKELKRDFNGYASIIIIINGYCCQKAFMATREIHWRIHHNSTLKKIAKIIINGFIYGHRDIDGHRNHTSDPPNSKFVITNGKRFKGLPSLAVLPKERQGIPYQDNTIVICGQGHYDLERQVPYDKNISLHASHPVATFVGAFAYELKKFLKVKTIREIADICIANIQANKEFKVDLEYEVYGIAGMFLHHIGPTIGIIINHYNYPEDIGMRTGSAHDVFALSNFFRTLKIPHYIIEDGNVDNVRSLMQWVSNADFSEFENIVIILMSHGGADGAVYTNDGEYNLFTDIRDPLLRNETLKNVRKFIFVNKCRGQETELRDHKVTSKKNLDSITKQLETSEDLMSETDAPKDLTMFYSCADGYVSKIFDHHGAPFIQTLVDGLQENAGPIDMKIAFQKVIDEVFDKMEEIDTYQCPEYFTTSNGDIIWNVETLMNLYNFKYGQLKVDKTSLSTRPFIGLQPVFAENIPNSDRDSEASQIRGRKMENLEKYAFYVVLRDNGNPCDEAITAENSLKIQRLLASIVLQNWVDKRISLCYAIIKSSSKFLIINCFNEYSMKLLNQIKYHRYIWDGAKLEITPLLEKSHSLTLAVPRKSFNSLEELKISIGAENPHLESHMWTWNPLSRASNTVCVELGLLDMELLEQNSMGVIYGGNKLKIKKVHMKQRKIMILKEQKILKKNSKSYKQINEEWLKH